MKTIILLSIAFFVMNTVPAQFSEIVTIDSLSTGTTDICTGDLNNDGL